MNMNIKSAIELVEEYLSEQEENINSFGSALPGYVNPNIKLLILSNKTEEYEFGWVFYYNSAKYIESGDINHALGGNAPLIVNMKNGELIETGTAHDSSYYVDNYIKTGNPHREE